MLLSAVSVLVVAQSSSEIPEGLMNNPLLLGAALDRFSQLFAVAPVLLYLIKCLGSVFEGSGHMSAYRSNCETEFSRGCQGIREKKMRNDGRVLLAE